MCMLRIGTMGTLIGKSHFKAIKISWIMLEIYRDDDQEDLIDNQNDDDDVDPLDLGAAHQQQVKKIHFTCNFGCFAFYYTVLPYDLKECSSRTFKEILIMY